METETDAKTCPNCGKEFIPTHHRQRHCSANCRKEFHRKQKKGATLSELPQERVVSGSERARQRARELRKRRIQDDSGYAEDTEREDRRGSEFGSNSESATGRTYSGFQERNAGIEGFIGSDVAGDWGIRSSGREPSDYRDLFGENGSTAARDDQRLSDSDEQLGGIYLLPEPKTTQKQTKEEKKKESQFRKKLNELAKVTSKSPLSGKEAEAFREVVKTVFELTFAQIDWIITHTNKAHEVSTIWTLDDEDGYKMADGWLALGKRSGTVAYTTRMINNAQSMGYVLMIPAGKIIETMIFYARNGGLGY